mmetsp:Transcript_28129/g.85956  ORF Transcript_28129/g.85956 Transcript_28129/m.85956 type:complete len:185 (+) Transcript_28129:3067-3621(+)
MLRAKQLKLNLQVTLRCIFPWWGGVGRRRRRCARATAAADRLRRPPLFPPTAAAEGHVARGRWACIVRLIARSRAGEMPGVTCSEASAITLGVVSIWMHVLMDMPSPSAIMLHVALTPCRLLLDAILTYWHLKSLALEAVQVCFACCRPERVRRGFAISTGGLPVHAGLMGYGRGALKLGKLLN